MQSLCYDSANFEQIRVLDTWRRYADRLTWGRGQCLAILDDGCDLSAPQWQVEMPWGRKVIATYNSVDDNADPTPVITKSRPQSWRQLMQMRKTVMGHSYFSMPSEIKFKVLRLG